MQQIQKLLQSDEPVKWLFYGDSITHGAFHTLGARDYTEHFAERVRFELGRGTDVIINTAISGHTTRDLCAGFDWRVRQFAPQAVFIMIGMNDCSASNDISPGEFRKNLQQLGEWLSDANAVPVFQTSCPILPGTTPDREPHFADYMQIVRDVAGRGNWPLIDHLALWNEKHVEHYYWMHDPFHPNAHGHLVFAHTLFRHLKIFDEVSVTCRLLAS